MRHVRNFAAYLLLALAGPAAAGPPLLIGVEEDTGDFYAISSTDAELQFVGSSGITGLGTLEFNPGDGFFYGFTTGKAPQLYRFDIAPTLDAVSSQAIGPLGIFVYEGALAFSPEGTAYAMNGGTTVPSLFTLNLATGQTTIVGPMEGRHDIAGLGWRDDGSLIAMDSTDNAFLAINPLNAAATTIDDIAPVIGGVGGMTLLGEIGYFVTGGPLAGPNGESPGSNELYSFDPLTGEHFFVGSFEETILGSGFSGLSVVPEPATLLLLSLAGLCLTRRCSPSRRSMFNWGHFLIFEKTAAMSGILRKNPIDEQAGPA